MTITILKNANGIKRAVGKQRAVLAQIAAYHGKASVKAVLRGVFLRQRRHRHAPQQ